MMLPDYWLTRPSVNVDEGIQNAFDELLHTTLSTDGCPTIEYTLPWPKWQFLCHLSDHHDIALHGSGNPQIHLFEPRQSNDLNEFGNQKAIYAASDGLWAMFFAIVDRERKLGFDTAVGHPHLRAGRDAERCGVGGMQADAGHRRERRRLQRLAAPDHGIGRIDRHDGDADQSCAGRSCRSRHDGRRRRAQPAGRRQTGVQFGEHLPKFARQMLKSAWL